MVKRYRKNLKSGVNPVSTWIRGRNDVPGADEDGVVTLQTGLNSEGTRSIQELFDPTIFNYSKPPSLLNGLLQQTTKGTDLVLDFFAGSGTTAQAVLELNAQDGGNRKFILVQLPEPTERKDFPTIADITKERVRRVIKKLETERAAKELKERKESEGQLELGSAPAPGAVSRALAGNTGASEQPHVSGNATRPELPTGASATAAEAAALPKPDLGFKVFKLSSSNFKVWDAASAPKDGAGLAEQLKLMAHNVEEGRPDEALLYELILKSNLPLTSHVVAGQIGGQTFYDVADGTLAICLERPVIQETLRGLVERKPKGVICLDIAFAGNDQLKANTVLEMKAHGIEFHTA
jgi:adenine-specific DNA-methyltransferase